MKLHHNFATALFALGSVTIAIPPAHAEIHFRDDFGTGNAAGWTLSSEWQIAAAVPSSGHEYGHPDPAADWTPSTDNAILGAMIGENVTRNVHDFYYVCTGSA